MEHFIDSIISALVSGGGCLYIGFKFLNKKPKPNGHHVLKHDCDSYKQKNSNEHKEIFGTLTDIKENTATLLERTKKL